MADCPVAVPSRWLGNRRGRLAGSLYCLVDSIGAARVGLNDSLPPKDRRNFLGSRLLDPARTNGSMAFASLQSILERAGLATRDQFTSWSDNWRKLAAAGDVEPQLAFFAKEGGLSEEQFLQRLASALGWPFLEAAKLTVSNDVRKRVSTKTAFQFAVLPAGIENGVLQLACHNPFDPAMQAAVQFDCQGPVKFGLATRGEIEKALKKYYGVGAETLHHRNILVGV